MKCAANLSYLWAELPFLDRFDAAAEAGFKAVEVQQPYDSAVPEMQGALARNGLEFLLLNAPGPNYTGGDRGFAAWPGGEKRFDYDMRRAIRYAQALKARFIHVLSGATDAPDARQVLVSNLKRACDILPSGLILTIEPLNAQSAPGYFLNDFGLAADIITDVGAANLALQFDSFHAQMITGDAARCFADHAPLIAHVQIGDAPERTAPGTGSVDFAALFSAMAQSGYDGWVSAEYTSHGPTEKQLGWMQEFFQV